MKQNNYHCLEYRPSKEDKEKMVNTIIGSQDKLVYKRLKSGKYKIFCFRCINYQTISKQEFEQVNAAHLCPICHNNITLQKKQDRTFYEWITLDHENDLYGYRIVVEWKFGRKPIIKYLKQVLYGDRKSKELYRKDIVRNMYSICAVETSGWRKIRSNANYLGYFYDADRELSEVLTKKEFYEKNNIQFLPLKSNQKKIVQENIVNTNQILYLLYFDLKKIEDLIKYRKYIRNNELEYLNINQFDPLNVYYLDYLSRNSIPLCDYIDYMRQCKELKLKLDKPKNFQQRHSDLSTRILWKKDKALEEKISKRYKSLNKKAYSNKNVSITPFNSLKQIQECANTFNNCIAGYAKDYAEGRCQLFVMFENGTMTAAIEVNRGRLIQARQKFNENCSKEQMKHIRKWCTQNKWRIN